LRLLIRLRARKTFPYDLAYRRNLQGLIYNLIRDSAYSSLHDKQGCKYFSFSNILPPTKIVQEGSRRSLLVASPDNRFIAAIMEKLRSIIGQTLRIGEMLFSVEGFEPLEPKLPEGWDECVISAGTPIVVRIPRYRCKEYAITPTKDYAYVYWRKEYSPTAFIKQLEENLAKKYKEYSRAEVEPLSIFERLRFKKQVAVPLQVEGEETTVIGTLWDFPLGALEGLKRDILQFGLDAGLGEMNSLGFGFMNLMKGDTHGEEAI